MTPRMAVAPDPFYEELRAVLRDPDADEPRFRYARRCGGSRAEFIETQLKLAALPGGVDNPEAPWLASHADDLLAEHGREFAPVWYSGRGVQAAGFDRGFVECLAATGHVLADSSLQGDLIKSAPIRHLNILPRCGSEALGEILNSTLGQQVVTLSLDDIDLGGDALQVLIHSKAARNLRWISLARTGLTVDLLEMLAVGRQWLPHLEYAYFMGNRCDASEQLAEDQGIVTGSFMPEAGRDLEEEFGRLAWLHPRVSGNRRVPVDRLALGRGAAHGITG